MKLKITIGEHDRTAIVLPIEHAGLAAELLSNATIFTQTGYYGDGPWEISKQQIRIEYTAEETLAPATKRELDAIKRADDKNSEWAKEYTKARDLEKQVGELKTALETLQAAVVCKVVEAEPEAPVTDEEE
jgi:hypothetical protein